MLYGYARVSSKQQKLDRQFLALKKMGAQKIFSDKASGKDFERKNFQRMMKKIRKGDTVFVESLDRFGRNYHEIIEQWKNIVALGADIVIVDMPVLDTRKKDEKNLLGSVITDIVLSLLSYVAESERKMIKERQRQGIICARERGVRFGRPKKVTLNDEHKAVLEKVRAGSVSRSEAAKKLGLTYSQVVYRLKLLD